MDEHKAGRSRSRRRFLSSGASALAGGLVGGAAYSSAAANPPKPGSSPALPWKWSRIDPMEAGSRAFRYYHDVGG